MAAVCGFLAFALFKGGGMLSRSLEGVDREALYEAVRAGLKNQNGRDRLRQQKTICGSQLMKASLLTLALTTLLPGKECEQIIAVYQMPNQ